VSESHPIHRTGLPWQNELSPSAWLATVALLATHPWQAYRLMRLHGSNLSDRLFVLILTALVTLAWGAAWSFYDRGSAGWVWATIVGVAMLVMTYIEVGGVTFVTWRRGWPVGWRKAERVACYAAIAWVPAAAGWCALSIAVARGWMGPMWLAPVLIPLLDRYQPLLATLLLAGPMLGFEALVWLGVRQVRHGNVPPAPNP
jgi:hypothetical protein